MTRMALAMGVLLPVCGLAQWTLTKEQMTAYTARQLRPRHERQGGHRADKFELPVVSGWRPAINLRFG